LPKETNQRKGSRSLGPPSANYPVLLAKSGRFGKSLSLRRIVFPFFAALRGCVKWLLKTCCGLFFRAPFVLLSIAVVGGKRR
jgi:hypothetical protein